MKDSGTSTPVLTESANGDLPPEQVRETLEAIRDVAHSAISHVGLANYRERQAEAHQWVNDAIDTLLDQRPSTEGRSTGTEPLVPNPAIEEAESE